MSGVITAPAPERRDNAASPSARAAPRPRRRARSAGVPVVSGVVARFLLILLALLAAPAASQTAAVGLYREGNALYRQGNFDAARQRYEAAVDAGAADARLFYNLGNACFKSQRLGEAVVWYERALRLAPRDEDVRANLRFVRRVKRDQEPGADADWLARLYLYPTLNELFGLASLSLLGVFAAACWRLWKRRGAVNTALLVAGAALFVLLGGFAGMRLQRQASLVEAVVTVEQGTARSGPEPGQTPVFVIHEGTKVTVERREGEWLLVRLGNGLGGWLPAAVVTVI